VDYDRERETGCDGSDTCQEIPHLRCSVPRAGTRETVWPRLGRGTRLVYGATKEELEWD
jgi:hypothetical protein